MKKKWLWGGVILVVIVGVGFLVHRHSSSNQSKNNNSQSIAPDKKGDCTSGYSHEKSRYPVTTLDPANCYKIQDYPCEKTGDCPKCLAASTTIKTDKGSIPVPELKVGDRVWSIDARGQKVLVAIKKVGRTKAPSGFSLKNIKLADGRLFTVSPNHPTSDGRKIADLHQGDQLDDSIIVSISNIDYGNQYTYDLLPASSTGYYWADGVLLGSTLKSTR